MRVKIEVSYLPESDPDYDSKDKLSDQEKTEKENEIKLYMSNIINISSINMSSINTITRSTPTPQDENLIMEL